MAVSKGRPLSHKTLHARITNISAATPAYVVSPFRGKIVQIYGVIDGALATADAVVTGAINGTPITGGVLTAPQAGSAAGNTQSATPTGANKVQEGDVISFTSNAASTNAVSQNITIVIATA